MDFTFKNQLLFDLYEGRRTNNKMFRSNPHLIKRYKLALSKIQKIDNLNQLTQFPGLHYERLRGNLNGYCSIRLDKKYRLIFREVFADYSITIVDSLEIFEISNHYS